MHDDSIGGDTESDTGANSPATSDWYGIDTSAGGSVQLDHADVRYATQAVSAYHPGSVVITNSVLRSTGYGISAVAPATEITLTDTSVQFVHGGPNRTLSKTDQMDIRSSGIT